MIKLFIDDIRIPVEARVLVTENMSFYFDDDWVIVRSYKDFIDWVMTNGLPDFISFDHDLGNNFDFGESREYTGYDCAKWLVNYCMDNDLNIPEFNVHSANPVGRVNIYTYMINAKKALNK